MRTGEQELQKAGERERRREPATYWGWGRGKQVAAGSIKGGIRKHVAAGSGKEVRKGTSSKIM